LSEPHVSLNERRTIAVEETRKSADGARAESLHSQEVMSEHARKNHWVTSGGILLAATLSLLSVLLSWFGLHTAPRQAPASAAYQQRMEELTAHQTEATLAQTAALDRLSKALIDSQKKAAIAQKEVVEAVVAHRDQASGPR
jgi:hypothetical protein